MGDRDARRSGDGHRRTHPRHHFDPYAVLPAYQSFFATAAENEGVAAFQSHDPLAGASVLDQERIDAVLGDPVPSGRFAHVDDLDVGREVIQDAARAEPIGDDDIGVHQGRPASQGEQPRVSRAAADEDNRAGGHLAVGSCGPASPAHREGAEAQTRENRVADRPSAPGIPIARDRDLQTLGGRIWRTVGDRGAPGSTVRAGVGPDAPDARSLGIASNRSVHNWKSSCRVHQPDSLTRGQVTAVVVLGSPLQDTGTDEVRELGHQGGRDDRDPGTVGEHPAYPAVGDRTAADDEDAALTELEGDRVAHGQAAPRPRVDSSRRESGPKTRVSIATPTPRMSRIDARTRGMSDNSRPVSRSWPSPGPSCGE